MKKLTLLFVFLLTSLAGYSQDDATLNKTSTTLDGKNYCNVKKEDCYYNIIEGDDYASLSGCDYSVTSINVSAQITYGGITYPVTTVGSAAIMANSSLQTLTLPEGIVTIGKYAFQNCPELETVTLPSTLTSIGDLAFAGCPKLNISIGENLTTIASGAFAGAKTISVNSNNTKYDSRDNCNCIIETSTNKLVAASKDINTIPSSVTSLGDDCFFGYAGTSIEIPNTIKTIGRSVFVWSQVTSITIPASVTKIEGLLTDDNVTSITVDANNPVYDSRDNCNAIIETKTNKLISGCTNTTIPESVTAIGPYAFFNLKFTTVTIPSSVASIEKFAFSSNDNPPSLTTVVSKILNPYAIPTTVFCHNDGFNTPLKGITLKVPKGTKDKYAATAGWNVITTVEEDETLGTVSTSATDEVNYVEKADQTVTIVSSESTGTEADIPKQVNGKDVSEIGTNAFAGKTNVTDIVLPETEKALELGTNALKIDDDHVATVHVPLSLLVDYALNEELKQNFEAGKVVATITAPNQYWTFSSGVDVLVPDGVKVYICKAINATDIQIVELTDAELTVDGKKVIKANNGVLISSTSGNAYDLVAKSGAQASGTIPAAFENANSYEGNKLVPVVRSQNYDPSQYYMLFNGGFINITDGDVSKTPACKALLKK